MISNEWFATGYEQYKFFIVILFIIFSLIVSNYAHRKGLFSPEENRRLMHATVGLIMSFSTIIFSSKFSPHFWQLLLFFLISLHLSQNCYLESIPKKENPMVQFIFLYLILSSLTSFGKKMSL